MGLARGLNAEWDDDDCENSTNNRSSEINKSTQLHNIHFYTPTEPLTAPIIFEIEAIYSIKSTLVKARFARGPGDSRNMQMLLQYWFSSTSDRCIGEGNNGAFLHIINNLVGI